MSNVLTRKRKRMEPLGYSTKELTEIQAYARRQKNTENLIKEAYLNVRLIAYQVLHDKFGFGHTRLIRVENTIDAYLESISEEELATVKLEYYLREKCGINVREEANQIPFRECFALTGKKIAYASRQTAGRCLAAAVCNYFSLLGTCLKTKFNFSARKVKECFEWVRYYLNSITGGYETMAGVASVLFYECKYCDARYTGKVYEI